MTEHDLAHTSNIFPCLRYRDAAAAIDWLVKAFEFEKHFMVPNADGSIAHCELKFGAGYVMVGSSREDAFLMKSPVDLGGVNASICVAIARTDVDRHFEKARAAGAEVVLGVEDTEYGARGYSVRDPEGNLWHFSSYSPEP